MNKPDSKECVKLINSLPKLIKAYDEITNKTQKNKQMSLIRDVLKVVKGSIDLMEKHYDVLVAQTNEQSQTK